MIFSRFLFRHFFGLLVAVIVLAGFVAPVHAKEILYQCPHLDDTTRMTISPMVQGYDGWFFRLEGDLKQDFELYPETLHSLQRLRDALKVRGTELIYLSIPTRGIVAGEYVDRDSDKSAYSPEKAKQSYIESIHSLHQTGINTPSFWAKDADTSLPDQFFFKRDHHWTPEGARLAAQAAAQTIRQHSLYTKLASGQYNTEAAETLEMKFTMAQEIERLCEQSIPGEPYQTYDTLLQASGENALFGNAGGTDNPPIALVGSSFSANSNFNLDGFLSEETGLAVANHAIAGGLLYNSLLSYLSSDKWQEHPPAFLLWEALSLYDANREAPVMFRQLIPAIYGDCEGEMIVAQQSLKLVDGKADKALLNVPSGINAYGTGYYLFISTHERNFSRFTLTFEHDNGDGEWFVVNRQDFFDNSGRFFIELSDDIDAGLRSVTLETPQPINAELHVKLCRTPPAFNAISSAKPE